jgi:hypothetical protein
MKLKELFEGIPSKSVLRLYFNSSNASKKELEAVIIPDLLETFPSIKKEQISLTHFINFTINIVDFDSVYTGDEHFINTVKEQILNNLFNKTSFVVTYRFTELEYSYLPEKTTPCANLIINLKKTDELTDIFDVVKNVKDSIHIQFPKNWVGGLLGLCKLKDLYEKNRLQINFDSSDENLEEALQLMKRYITGVVNKQIQDEWDMQEEYEKEKRTKIFAQF